MRLACWFVRLAQTNLFSGFVIVCYDARQWVRAHRTNGNLSIGKNCQMEVDDTSVNSLAAPADARVTSRRLMWPNERLDSLRKFTTPAIALSPYTRNFPVDL